MRRLPFKMEPGTHVFLWKNMSTSQPQVKTKSPPPKSILARFGPVKRQNLSTAPDKCVDHLRFAVDASAPLQNRPGTHIFLWKNMCTSQPQVKTESPPPKSILARFGPVKRQNLSTAPDKCVDYLRFAVDASAPLQNRTGTHIFLWKNMYTSQPQVKTESPPPKSILA